MEKIKRCRKCGARLLEHEKRCPVCGTPVGLDKEVDIIKEEQIIEPEKSMSLLQLIRLNKHCLSLMNQRKIIGVVRKFGLFLLF